MPRKKIVFVIVEGPSDDDALGILFHKIFDKSKVHIEITHGDITSDYNIAPDSIPKSIAGIVKNYADSMHLKQLHFQQVIHIVDMDGAYIHDSYVIHDPEAEKPFYTLEEIRTAKPKQLIERNEHKRQALDRISRLSKVWKTIPYQAYYMSSNLDHVLHNRLNSSDEEKEQDAYAFAKKYKDDIPGFLSFIKASDFSVMIPYVESWKHIKQNGNSLKRYTNLGLCFPSTDIDGSADQQEDREKN